MLSANACTKRELALIGKVLQKENPDIFSRLKSLYIDIQPQQTDFSRIPSFYEGYCQITGNPITTTTDRRIFIASMLQVYCPHLITHPTRYRLPRSGFGKQISQVLGITKHGTHYLIKQAIVWIRMDNDFKTKAEYMVERLKQLAE